MPAVQSLRLFACAYYYNTLGLEDVVGIAQEEFHAGLFGYLPHCVGEFLQIVVGYHSHLYDVDALAFGSSAGGCHHLSGHGEYMLVAQVSFVLYHNLNVVFLNESVRQRYDKYLASSE